MSSLLSNLVAVALGLLGLVFVLGSQGMLARLVVGVVLIASAVAVLALQRMRAPSVEIKQSLDLSGAVSLKSIPCQSCGASLSRDDVAVKAGAVFVNCSHCGASYQLEEAPLW